MIDNQLAEKVNSGNTGETAAGSNGEPAGCSRATGKSSDLG